MNYTEHHENCKYNIEGYCSKYGYIPVKNINHRCEWYKKDKDNEKA